MHEHNEAARQQATIGSVGAAADAGADGGARAVVVIGTGAVPVPVPIPVFWKARRFGTVRSRKE